MVKIISILALFFAFVSSCLADEPHVVHNVFREGFSINGYDILFDSEEVGLEEIKLGDQYFIEHVEFENVAGNSYRYILHLTDIQSNATRSFKTRVMNDEEFMVIKAVKKLASEKYQVTFEDGTQYVLQHNNETAKKKSPVVVKPGDKLAFQPNELIKLTEPPYYAIDIDRKNNSWDYAIIFADGSSCSLNSNTFWEVNKGSSMGSCDGLFFGGAVMSYHYIEEPNVRTWAYPNCCFPLGVVTRDHTRLPGYFRVEGPFRKPNALIAPNTFRVRAACAIHKRQAFEWVVDRCVLEFYDFYPGTKFIIRIADDLGKVCDCPPLHFLSRIGEKQFVFEKPNGQLVILIPET